MKKSMKVVFCAIIGGLVVWSLFLLPAYADVINPRLVADTYVDRDLPGENYGAADDLDCHYGIIEFVPGEGAHYLIRHILLRFDQGDLATIPETDEITRATLRAYVNSAVADSHVYMDVAIVNTDWAEGTVTWDILGQRLLYPRSPRITIHVGEAAGWYEWDITPIVEDWHSGFHENYGIALAIYLEAGTPIEDYSRIFDSKEGNPARSAQLEVEYTPTLPPTDVDLTLDNYEITQAVQFLDDPTEPDNSVTLIAHKPTIIRFYVDIGPAAGPVHHVSGRLYRRVSGIEESIPPLNPIVAEASPERGDHHQTLNFRLPAEWLEGTWDFYAVINPGGAVRESDDTNNRYPAVAGTYVDVDFEADDRELDIAWLKVHYTWSGFPGSAWASDRVGWQQTANYLRAVYPIAPHRMNYFPWPGASLGDWDTDIDSNASALLAAIDDLRDTSTLDPKPDILFGWVPEDAYPSGRGLGQLPGDSSLAQDDNGDNWLYRIIFTHEVGHNMDQDGHGSLPQARLTGGEFGYDVMGVDLADRVVMRQYTDGGATLDMIDFMRGGGPAPGLLDGNWGWVTPYTYEDIHSEMTSRGFVAGGGAGAFASQETMYVSGIIDLDGSGLLRPIYHFSSHSPDNTEDGPYYLDVFDGKGNRIYHHPFDARSYIDFLGNKVNRIPFSYFLPADPAAASVQLSRRDDVYFNWKASDNLPAVRIVYPNGGEILKGVETVMWQATDADRDKLSYMLLYSPDGGGKWTTIATGLTKPSHAVNVDSLPGSKTALFRVIASDGFWSDRDDSDDFFMVGRKAPQAAIIVPDKEVVLAPDYPMMLIGQGYDPEDGVIRDEGLIWESNRDGFLGTGHILEHRFSLGIHEVTLEAEDSDGKTGTDTIVVHNLKGTVYRDKDQDGFGDPLSTIVVLDAPPAGYVSQTGDCNDKNSLRNPDAPDTLPDGIDNNCNRFVDEGAAKWLQEPDVIYGVNIRSEIDEPLVADDWLCTDGRPIVAIHFWGSYIDTDGGHWQEANPGPPVAALPPSPGIKGFRIGIFKGGGSQPGDNIREYKIGPEDIQEIYWQSSVREPDEKEPWWEHKFYYVVRLKETFAQKEETVYWLAIGAETWDEKWRWGWETSSDHWNANAHLYWPQNNYWQEIKPGEWPMPDWYPHDQVDMAFMLITKSNSCVADFDQNGVVDGLNLATFAVAYENGYPEADLDGIDGVNEKDVAIFADDFGRTDCRLE